MKLLIPIRSLRILVVAGAGLLSGCSLLGGDGELSPSVPPMFGSSEPAQAAPKFRQKYRFPSEVANLRKDDLRRKASAARPGAAAPAPQTQIAATAPAPQSQIVATPTQPGTWQSGISQPAFQPPGTPYPSTGAAPVIAASAYPMAQRLPDIRQASYGERPLY